ncbi:MAG: hypothetical protein GXO85_04380 [Chlorobi bacterium]|nr:hypothetical protein [Chlorobiota bacterium]
MKTFLFILFFLSLSLSAQNISKYNFKHHDLTLPIDNRGILADTDLYEYTDQMRYKSKPVIYSSGFMLSGLANDSLLWVNGVITVERNEDYVPGSYKHSEFDSLAKIYVLKNSDAPFGDSWQNWKDAVKLGADFYDGDNDGLYNPVDKNSNGKWDTDEDRPDLLGDQTAWCVYKDAVPNGDRNFFNSQPVGIEIQQTVFASSINESFENTIFVRYRIENTGIISDNLDSVYFSVYSDPDLGLYKDDLVGCDTLIDAGYVYQTIQDSSFMENTPSVIIQFAQGPISFLSGETFIDHNNNGIFDSTDTPLSVGYNNKGSVLGSDKITGAVNLRMTSFSNFLPFTNWTNNAYFR